MNSNTPFFNKNLAMRFEFPTINDSVQIPNVLKICKSSYNEFTQRFVPIHLRKKKGLEYLFNRYFGKNYLRYEFGTCPYNIEECIQHNYTYSIPVYVYLKHENHNIKRFYIGDIPLLTRNGSFIYRGIEKTVVNQLIRDSGMYINNIINPAVQSSLKIRGTKGKYIQLDLFKSGFLGRKLNAVIIKKNKEYRHSHQDMSIYLNNVYISFFDMVAALTFTPIYYKYSLYGWYHFFDWNVCKKYRLLDGNGLNTVNIFTKTNTCLNKDSLEKVLNVSIRILFNTNTIDKICKQKYILIDIHNIYGKSIFSVNEILRSNKKDTLYYLLSLVGTYLTEKTTTIYLIDSLRILDLLNKVKLVFIIPEEKGKYYNTIVLKQIDYKKKELSILLKENIPYHMHSSNLALNTTLPFNNLILSKTGIKKIQLRLGIRNRKSSLLIGSNMFTHIIRYLLQIGNGLISTEHLQEQDLFYKKLNATGEQLYSFLEDGIEQYRYKQDIRVSVINREVTSKIRYLRKIFQYLLTFFSRSSLCQYTEQVNPLSYITHGRKISIMGPGGLQNDNVGLEMRDVHISSYGRICPIETPEGMSVGVVTSLSIYSRINKNYQIETPYIRVKNGIVTGKIYYLSPIEEIRCYIALGSERTAKDGSFINTNNLYCKYNQKTVIVHSCIQIEYIELSPKQTVSLSSSMIPFLEHNDANRALMGSNMQRQAVPLVNVEIPIIGTCTETITPRDINTNLSNVFDNIPTSSLRNFIALVHNSYSATVDNIPNNIDSLIQCNLDKIKIYELSILKNTNQKTCVNYRSNGVINNNVIDNIKYFDGYSYSNNSVSLGNNILIAFTSMNGHTFEDSIVISERLLREGYLRSTHLDVYKTAEVFGSDFQEVIIRVPTLKTTFIVDRDGVSYLGRKVRNNDILISKEKRQLSGINKNKLVVSDKSIRYDNKIEGYVIQVNKFFSNTQENSLCMSTTPCTNLAYLLRTYSIHRKAIKVLIYMYVLRAAVHRINIRNNVRYILDCLDFGLYVPRQYLWLTSQHITYDYLTERNINKFNESQYLYECSRLYQKYCCLKQSVLRNDVLNIAKELRKNEFLFTINNLISKKYDRKQYSKHNVNISINNIKKKQVLFTIKKQDTYFDIIYLLEKILPFIVIYYLRFFEENKIQYIKKHNSIKNYTNYRKNYHLKMVQVTTITTHNIQVGDKLTGRYGNKGVISRIMAMEDMPYLKDGTSIDIVLSPLGVSSRMNIGQLFEAQLGIASIEVGNKIQNLLLSKKLLFYKNIRVLLSILYKNKKESLVIHNMDKKDILSVYKQVSYGLAINSPVFDSADSNDIDSLIRMNNLKKINKVSLVDGVTGALLDNMVTIGYLYIMKLNHLIDHKIHGRSTGPYNVLTQQASKGKSKHGGQRLGEMEVWSLQAYGAAYTLQEMLTFKSDSTVARTNFLQKFITGKSYRIDMPRTFRLLRDELRVLGMELSIVVSKYQNNT